MKSTATLLLLFISLNSFSQLSVSLGADKRYEGEFFGSYNPTVSDLFTVTFFERYWSDYYSINADYEFRKWMFSSSISYLYNSYTHRSRYSDQYGGGSGYSSSYSSTGYAADVTYSYLGIGGQTRKVLFNKKFHLLLGLDFKIDIRVSEKEINHQTTSYGSGYSLYNPGANYSSNNGTTYDYFNSLQVEPLLFTIGHNFALRYDFDNLFIEIPFSIGLSNKSRTTSLQIPKGFESSSILYFQYGIRIGYTFKTFYE